MSALLADEATVSVYLLWRQNLKSDRNNRALKLVRKLNHIRHRQEQQIDILCNDIIGAQRDFIKQLRVLTFGVNFYELLLGHTDITSLLDSVGAMVRERIPGSNVAVFLIGSHGFKLHMADDDQPIDVDAGKIESYFTEAVVNDICRSNRICTLEDMCHIGLQGNPNVLNKISAAAVPLGKFGDALGFVLICRSADMPLKAEELEGISAIVPGLSRAVTAYTELPTPNN